MHETGLLNSAAAALAAAAGERRVAQVEIAVGPDVDLAAAVAMRQSLPGAWED